MSQMTIVPLLSINLALREQEKALSFIIFTSSCRVMIMCSLPPVDNKLDKHNCVGMCYLKSVGEVIEKAVTVLVIRWKEPMIHAALFK